MNERQRSRFSSRTAQRRETRYAKNQLAQCVVPHDGAERSEAAA